ncbi:MAG: hypothetical protein L0Z62_50480 [Gemmataceae bacterium]|nr:hypothetical protein [Gemmataceae bacterium]
MIRNPKPGEEITVLIPDTGGRMPVGWHRAVVVEAYDFLAHMITVRFANETRTWDFPAECCYPLEEGLRRAFLESIGQKGEDDGR